MNMAEKVIEEIRVLPEFELREVLDFVGYLKTRHIAGEDTGRALRQFSCQTGNVRMSTHALCVPQIFGAQTPFEARIARINAEDHVPLLNDTSPDNTRSM